MSTKRDYRLLLILALLIVSISIFIFDAMDHIEYIMASVSNNDAYFEDRFGVKKPVDLCFDCWPPLRNGWEYFWMSGFGLSITGILYCWWKPKK